jgi:hypothetical protein
VLYRRLRQVGRDVAPHLVRELLRRSEAMAFLIDSDASIRCRERPLTRFLSLPEGPPRATRRPCNARSAWPPAGGPARPAGPRRCRGRGGPPRRTGSGSRWPPGRCSRTRRRHSTCYSRRRGAGRERGWNTA